MQALMRDEPPHLHSQAFGCLKGRKTAACVRCSANCSSLTTCGQAAVSGWVWGLWKRLRRSPVATCTGAGLLQATAHKHISPAQHLGNRASTSSPMSLLVRIQKPLTQVTEATKSWHRAPQLPLVLYLGPRMAIYIRSRTAVINIRKLQIMPKLT